MFPYSFDFFFLDDFFFATATQTAIAAPTVSAPPTTAMAIIAHWGRTAELAGDDEAIVWAPDDGGLESFEGPDETEETRPGVDESPDDVFSCGCGDESTSKFDEEIGWKDDGNGHGWDLGTQPKPGQHRLTAGKHVTDWLLSSYGMQHSEVTGFIR